MPVTTPTKELIVVRRLARSDLGLFAAHREEVRSKQRAININAGIARQLFSAAAFDSESVTLQCTCTYRGTVVRAPRLLGKSHKNWRLGGPRIEGEIFRDVAVDDFVLLRSVEGNDGSSPIAIGFVTASHDSVKHHGLAGLVSDSLETGMALFRADADGFDDYLPLCPREYIAVRSLAESDLGLFTEHREGLYGRQRAFNINTSIAREMIDPSVYERRGENYQVVCRFGTRESRGTRPLKKVGKNWRLGGPKMDGKEFARLDAKDFLLIRSFQWNDGSQPIALTLIGRKTQAMIHTGLVTFLTDRLHNSMTIVADSDPAFAQLAKYCPGS